MTINERAEKLVRGDWSMSVCGEDCHCCPSEREWRELESRIASQIKEAIDEVVCQVRLQEIEISKKVREETYRNGWNDGVDKAVEIAESCYFESNLGNRIDCTNVDNVIRSLRKESK